MTQSGSADPHAESPLSTRHASNFNLRYIVLRDRTEHASGRLTGLRRLASWCIESQRPLDHPGVRSIALTQLPERDSQRRATEARARRGVVPRVHAILEQGKSPPLLGTILRGTPVIDKLCEGGEAGLIERPTSAVGMV